MPFILILLGLGMIITAARGKENDLVAILEDDFASKDSFIPWLVAFAALGFVGSSSKEIRPFTDAFSVLILVVLITGKMGFVEQFQRQALQ